AAVDEAADRLSEATGRVERLGRELAGATEDRDAAAAALAGVVARMHESDAELAATAERLAALGATARAAAAEAERLATSVTDAETARDRDLAGLADLERRLAAAEEAGDVDVEPSTEERDRLAAEARAARQAETEARLALRTG